MLEFLGVWIVLAVLLRGIVYYRPRTEGPGPIWALAMGGPPWIWAVALVGSIAITAFFPFR